MKDEESECDEMKTATSLIVIVSVINLESVLNYGDLPVKILLSSTANIG